MIEQTIQENCGFLRGKTCVVAVSGGIDSMVLLSAMNRLKKALALTLAVAHFEHGIRGEASLLDARLVERTAKQMGLPFFLRQEDIPSLAQGKNLEQVARERRYAFLRSLPADYLLTAHHAGDLAETVLMKMTRGCGLDGLCGMSIRQGKLVRPLLTTDKADISAYARQHQVEYREDATNADLSYARNALRAQVIPCLLAQNPQFFTHLHKMTQILQQQRDFLDLSVSKADCLTYTNYGGAIKKDAFLPLHPALQQRAVKEMLNTLMQKDMTAEKIEDVLSLFTLPVGRKKQMNDRLWAYSSYGQVCLVFDQPKIEGEFLLGKGENDTPLGQFVLTPITGRPADLTSHLPDVAYVDAGVFPLRVRSRRSGDVFVPFGHHQPKKLKDILIDHKIPVFLRDQFPVVVFQKDVIFLPGIGQSNASRICGENAYQIRYFPTQKREKQD